MKTSLARGDGIGPEVMDAVLTVFGALDVPLTYDVVPMGEAVALSGERTRISSVARKSVESTGILLHGPMANSNGRGHCSVGITARKLWGAFANKRVYRTLPGVPCPRDLHRLNLTMIREKHMPTHDVAQCRSFITRAGSRQFHRYAFEVAAKKGAHKVTCAHIPPC